MRQFYVIIGWVSLIGGISASALAVIAVLESAPESVRALRSIQAGITWLVAFVAFGNVDRLDIAEMIAERKEAP